MSLHGPGPTSLLSVSVKNPNLLNVTSLSVSSARTRLPSAASPAPSDVRLDLLTQTGLAASSDLSFCDLCFFLWTLKLHLKSAWALRSQHGGRDLLNWAPHCGTAVLPTFMPALPHQIFNVFLHIHPTAPDVTCMLFLTSSHLYHPLRLESGGWHASDPLIH